MSVPFDAVLMVAFGGPTGPEEIGPFLVNVLRGVAVAPGRLEEVARHYRAVGGRSPLKELTFRQAEGLRKLLEREGPRLSVYVGMRHWHPFVGEAVQEMMRDGVRRAVGLIMAAHDSGAASWRKYERSVTDALAGAGPEAPTVEFAGACYDHPGFVGAVADRVRAVLEGLASEQRAATPLVFSAHSIPAALAAATPYVAQLLASCRLVAEALEHPRWTLAYQSRSGDGGEPWLGPHVLDVLAELRAGGCRSAVLVPIGFLCDHVEVLFDLDVEARDRAATLGMEFRRAGAVNDHPAFIGALADLVRRRAGHE